MTQKNHLVTLSKVFILSIGMLLVLLSCGEAKKSPELEEAFKIHNEALAIRGEMSKKLSELQANKDSIFVETHAATLSAIGTSLEEWDEQLVEVPGFEHEHDHSGHDHSEHDHSEHDHSEHDHNHDHNEQELTPKQHLEVQQQLLEDITAIAEKIEGIQ
ncbi:MAG: hypothetical protein ACFB0A_14505 [Croceivirga sp.]